MKPAKAANQLTHLWRTICPNENLYPVDCELLAEALNIKVHGEAIDDQFEAMLRIRNKRRAIIYNKNIREEGRKNFCISHEIGHASCHTDREEFLCTIKDLNDIAPHPLNIEQEANLFAATLLMPADDFRDKIQLSKCDLAMISRLAEYRYKTSLTATCKRLLDLSPKTPIGMAFVRDGKVLSWDRSEEMKYTGFGFRSGERIEDDALFINSSRTQVDSLLWLNKKNAGRWDIFQSSIQMPYYDKTLFLVFAERVVKYEDIDEPDPTPQRIPSF